MGRLVLSKFCSLMSSIFDLIGIGSFRIGQSFDDWSNDLMDRPRFDFPEIIKKLTND